jgi:polyisoprenoid-binding protein YceI
MISHYEGGLKLMSNATATKSLLPTGTWKIDPVHSQVSFAVDYHVGTFRGSFSPIDGSLVVGDDGTTTLTGSVPVSGVKVDAEQLFGHLQSPDFFDAERAPELIFSSSAIRPAEGGIEVEGELSIKGASLPVVARGSVKEPTTYSEREYLGLSLETTIDRTKYGINWNNTLPDGRPALANEVRINADLFFVKT